MFSFHALRRQLIPEALLMMLYRLAVTVNLFLYCRLIKFPSTPFVKGDLCHSFGFPWQTFSLPSSSWQNELTRRRARCRLYLGTHCSCCKFSPPSEALLHNLSLTFICQDCAQFRVTSQIYFDITHGGRPLGRITFGLFGDDAPKTVENFREICLRGIDGLSYNGTRFHRVIKHFMVQGGDILNGDGTGSTSIYGEHFEDENLTINHTIGGFLGMANHGPDTNGCQFYITTIGTAWLDGQHTVLGKVINGECGRGGRKSIFLFQHLALAQVKTSST